MKRSTAICSAVLGALLGTVTGCEEKKSDAPEPSASPAATVPAPAPSAAATAAEAEAKRKPMNVLFITIDSMRHDMPWQGYEKDIAPNLTKLAKESVVYTKAYTISSFTSKSVGALLSGRYPSSLYRGCSFFTEYSKANEFFPEILQRHGVTTLAGHAHLYFDRGKNLRQGFDEWRLVEGLTWNAETDESVTSEKMTDMAIEMLGGVKSEEKPFFAWFHYMDPHDKYVRHEGVPDFGHRARQLYDAEIYYTDLHVQRLFDWAKTQPWFDETAIIVSADHGEAFGEHGMWKHAFALWEVLTHVPLIVKIPGAPARRIEARRSQIDLPPTIMDLVGVEPPASMVGESLVPELLAKKEPASHEPILLDLPADSYNPPTKAIILGDYKLIKDPGKKYKLYELSKDPDETRNLVGLKDHAEAFEKMKKALEEAWSKHPAIEPYGGCKLVAGNRANGPKGPEGWVDPDEKSDGED